MTTTPAMVAAALQASREYAAGNPAFSPTEQMQVALEAAERATWESTESAPKRHDPNTPDAMRHKLIADIFDLPIWERGNDRVVTPPWHALTVAERDLIADALKQWKPA